MTPRIPKVIPRDGKVWRLTQESWYALREWDSDPNIAIGKLVKAMQEKNSTLSAANPVSAPQHNTGCAFDEKKMQKIVKDTMEAVIAPFTGG